MNHSTHTPLLASLLFLSSMLFVSTAHAATDINKCVAASGQVTLTDEVCPGDSQTVKVSNGLSDSALAAAPQRSGAAQYKMAHAPARLAARDNLPARGLALDVMTLKTARANMHLFDATPQRSQRLASLQ